MKTKEYLLTESEICIIRDALLEYYRILRGVNSVTVKKTEALKDQFKADAANI